MTSGVTKLRWVRPLQRILCVFDHEVVPLNVDGIPSTDLTEGHRFMGSGQAFRVKGFDDYAAGLARNYVVLDPDERKASILDAARTLCLLSSSGTSTLRCLSPSARAGWRHRRRSSAPF